MPMYLAEDWKGASILKLEIYNFSHYLIISFKRARALNSKNDHSHYYGNHKQFKDFKVILFPYRHLLTMIPTYIFKEIIL